jgi:adenylyltransferase/sulfurtransferase
MQGQLAVFDSSKENSPCYSCLYKEGEDAEQTCAETGVLAPLVGIIGSMQALEAIKLILSVGNSLAGRLVVFDGLQHEWRTLKLLRDPACPVCS